MESLLNLVFDVCKYSFASAILFGLIYAVFNKRIYRIILKDILYFIPFVGGIISVVTLLLAIFILFINEIFG